MAQDLASLVIGLRADVAQLQSDLGKASALNRSYAKSASDDWTKSAAEIGKAFGAAVVAAAGIGAAIAKQAIDAADGFNKMSQKIGISVESLSALNVQAKLSDVSIDQLQGGLAKLARNAADAAAGNKQSAATFQALGVSLKDANGNLRSTEDLLGDVAAKFAGYTDSAAKTALAQEAFGKSGAELIPLLNQLGTEGFAKAREEAEKYGAVISGETAAAAEHFNDNLTKLTLETQGFANAVVAELLPSLNKLTDSFVDAGQAGDGYRSSADAVSTAVKGLVLGLITAKEFLSSVATVTFAFYDAIKTSFTASAEVVAAFATTAYQQIKGALTFDPAAIDASRKQFASTLAAIGGDVSQSFKAVSMAVGGSMAASVDTVRESFNSLFGTFSNVSAGAETTAGALHKVNAPLVENVGATTSAADAQAKYNDSLSKAATFLSQLQGSITPVDQAYEKYVATIIKSNQIQQDIIDTATKAGKAQEGYAQAVTFGANASKAANQQLDQTLQKLEQQADVVGRLRKEYGDQAALVGLTDREHAIADAVQKATDEWQKNTDAHIKNKQTLDEVQTSAAGLAAGLYDLTKAADASQAAAKEFQQIWVDAGRSISDAFAQWVVEGGSLMDSLVDIAKRVVEQIIAQFIQLQVIGPILQGIFGGGGGGYGGLISAAGGGGYSGLISAGVQAFGGDSTGASQFSTGGNGYTSLFSAGKTMWSGFQSGYQSMFQGTDAFTMGPPDASGATSSYYGGGYTSGWGQALGVAGGIYAGYNRYQQAGGGVGGVAGGLAYGAGTYFAGAGLATAGATGSLAAGAAAIPVVGWIALAAMLVDMVSGGKLFGTEGKFNFGKQQTFIGPDGATVVAGYDMKGQSALFGGSTHSWHDLPVDPAAQAAAQQFYDALKNQTEAFAKQFGTTVGDIVGGEFAATFDKKGNIKSSQSTVLGVTYDEDQAHFQTRLAAENMVAVLDSLNSGLSQAIDQYRQNADQLMAVTQQLANAQGMLQAGTKFLALGSDQSLTALLALAQGMQGFGESIDQTLQRIEQAQAQYDQFTAQFKPQTSYVDDFEGALSGINQQMLANIKQANALAVAAGAAGASEEDLANIHEYAAHQAAALIQALEQSAQSLAFSLGLTTQGSLSDVSAEIARLQSKANEGASAVSNFGSAMSTAAQKATDAMSLLLGDLSPLNDQAKLQTALQGLRAGTATAQQVLEIGRRLYASSQAYTDLFNTVQSLGRGGTAATNAGGSSIRSTGGGLSGEERQRLSDLLKEQQTLQAAATLGQYQTLAQQIAEIASAKGEDWRQVLDEMGINIADFEAGLKMTDAQTDDYIAQQQKQLDSNNENTKSIIDSLNDGFDRVVVALGGTPTHSQSGDMTQGSTGSSTTPVPGSFGHSSHGRSYEDGQDLGRGFRDVILATGPRGTRSRMAA